MFKVYSNSYGESYAKAGGYTYEIIGTHTHIWDDGSVIIEATCEDSGTCVYSCTLCGMDRYETIPLNDHSWQDWVIVQEPKCEWIGEKERTCSVCNEVETETIPALGGHLFGDYQITTQPTVFEEGEKTRECSRCHFKETRELPKLAASMELTRKTLTVKVKESVAARTLIASMGTGDDLAYLETSDRNIVQINNNTFMITGKKAGQAVIAITLKSGIYQELTVNVKSEKVATKKISGIKKKITLRKGKKFTLKPVLYPRNSTEKVTYISSNKKVAKVSAKGVIKAVKKGKAKITVKSGKKKVTCTVTVK